MQTFDASSIMYAWDNYPPEQFPPLWRWIAVQIKNRHFNIPRVAYEEVVKRLPPCAEWLNRQDIDRVVIDNDIVQEAFRIKEMLGIVADRYSPKGVGENDLLIIAAAKVHDLQLVSNESRQNQFPKNIANCKIPAVCSMTGVELDCIDFITLIRNSGEVFEGSAV